MSKRKSPTPHGQHGDKYAAKPRAAAPPHAETETPQSRAWFRCEDCAAQGDAVAMERHATRKRGHWKRVVTERPTATTP